MKNLTLIIHEDRKADIADLLRGIKEISGFTLSEVESHSRHSDDNPQLSDRDKVVGFVPRIRVDVQVEDQHVEKILAAIRGGGIGLRGCVHYWLLNIVDQGQI
jgi:nitrogen regulatory protein PII